MVGTSRRARSVFVASREPVLATARERARAIQFAATHAARLRTELGVDPDADFQATLSRLQQPVAHSSGIAPSPPAAQPDYGVRGTPALAPTLPDESRYALDTAVTPSFLRRPRFRRGLAALAGLGMVSAATIIAVRFQRSEPLPVVGEISAMTFEPGVEIEPSLSPDGRYVAYSGGTPPRLYLRQRGSRPIPLVTPDSGAPQHRPRWSPDGTRIAFDAGRRIFVIPALGGAPRQVVADGWSPTWAPDGQRIAYALDDTIFTIDVRGAPPVRLANVIEPAELSSCTPRIAVASTSGRFPCPAAHRQPLPTPWP